MAQAAVANISNIQLTYKDFNRLQSPKPGKEMDSLINDSILDSYSCLLREYHARKGNEHTNLFTSSHFYTLLCSDDGLTRTRSWYTPSQIFNADRIFIPINLNSVHWVLVVLDMINHRIEYWDPLHLLCERSIFDKILEWRIRSQS